MIFSSIVIFLIHKYGIYVEASKINIIHSDRRLILTYEAFLSGFFLGQDRLLKPELVSVERRVYIYICLEACLFLMMVASTDGSVYTEAGSLNVDCPEKH